MTTVRRLLIGESELFKRIRLTALSESPSAAFGSSYGSALKRSPEVGANKQTAALRDLTARRLSPSPTTYRRDGDEGPSLATPSGQSNRSHFLDTPPRSDLFQSLLGCWAALFRLQLRLGWPSYHPRFTQPLLFAKLMESRPGKSM